MAVPASFLVPGSHMCCKTVSYAQAAALVVRSMYSVNSHTPVSLHCILPGAILAVPTHISPGSAAKLALDALF